MLRAHSCQPLYPLVDPREGMRTLPNSPKPPEIPPNPSPWPCRQLSATPQVSIFPTRFCSGAGPVAETFGSTRSLQLLSRGSPLPPHHCPANLTKPSQFSQKDKVKSSNKFHERGVGTGEWRRAELR